MTNLTWQYVAGFFDGEGHIGTHANRARRSWFGSVATFAQSGKEGAEILGEIKAFLKEHGVVAYLRCQPRSQSNTALRDMWSLKIASRPNLTTFLRFIVPHLRVKRVVAEDHLRFLAMFPSARGHQTDWVIEKRAARQPLVWQDFNAGMSAVDVARKYGVHVATIAST